jgi:hypothetical protein
MNYCFRCLRSFDEPHKVFHPTLYKTVEICPFCRGMHFINSASVLTPNFAEWYEEISRDNTN